MHCWRKDSFDDCPATESTSTWLITALLCGTGHSPLNSTPIAHVELIIWSVGASELPWQWNFQCIAGGKIVSTIVIFIKRAIIRHHRTGFHDEQTVGAKCIWCRLHAWIGNRSKNPDRYSTVIRWPWPRCMNMSIHTDFIPCAGGAGWGSITALSGSPSDRCRNVRPVL